MPIWTPNLAGQPEGRQQKVEKCSEQGLRVGAVEGAKAGVLSTAFIGGLYYFSPWFKKATRTRCARGRASRARCRRRVAADAPRSSRTALIITPIVLQFFLQSEFEVSRCAQAERKLRQELAETPHMK